MASGTDRIVLRAGTDPGSAWRTVDRPHAGSSEWGSLVADLSTGAEAREPAWRIHDRTHLEFAVDYRLTGAATERYEWEAFFFVPRSLRLDANTYPHASIERDLQSYVRFVAPRVGWAELAHEPLSRLEEALAGKDTDLAIRELRLFACQLRAAGVAAGRAIARGLDDDATRAEALATAERMIDHGGKLRDRIRQVLAPDARRGHRLSSARELVDEDVSRLLETLFGTLSRQLDDTRGGDALSKRASAIAVGEARYRDRAGLGGVGHRELDSRETEHLEFRRHVTKRYTSSVLWLKPVATTPGRWTLHALYAIAAGVAMAFALAAALANGMDVDSDRLWLWCFAAVIAYMAKDRIKASLQGLFAASLEKRLPHRAWLLNHAGAGDLGKMEERTEFVSFDSLSDEARHARVSTRKNPLEGEARPETILRHQKVVTLEADAVRSADARFDGLTEIFRLDLRRWLVHTDDPKRRIVYADPDTGKVRRATAPRVYNVNIVYRLRRDGEEPSWRRVRVVVSRKGIKRIDAVSLVSPPRAPA